MKTLLWQALYQQAPAHLDDYPLYSLLQHRPGAAQFGCTHSDRNAPAGASRIKAASRLPICWPKIFMFFSALLAGCGSGTGGAPFLLMNPAERRPGSRILPSSYHYLWDCPIPLRRGRPPLVRDRRWLSHWTI